MVLGGGELEDLGGDREAFFVEVVAAPTAELVGEEGFGGLFGDGGNLLEVAVFVGAALHSGAADGFGAENGAAIGVGIAGGDAKVNDVTNDETGVFDGETSEFGFDRAASGIAEGDDLGGGDLVFFAVFGGFWLMMNFAADGLPFQVGATSKPTEEEKGLDGVALFVVDRESIDLKKGIPAFRGIEGFGSKFLPGGDTLPVEIADGNARMNHFMNVEQVSF